VPDPSKNREASGTDIQNGSKPKPHFCVICCAPLPGACRKNGPPRKKRRLVHIDGNCDPILGIPAVVQVIAVVGVVDIHVIVFVPVVGPVFGDRVQETEPVAVVLEAGIAAKNYQREAVNAEPVIPAEVTAEPFFRNMVTVVAATLLPGAVLGLESIGAMLLPHITLFTLLHALPLL
jgi:hypothetical protein